MRIGESLKEIYVSLGIRIPWPACHLKDVRTVSYATNRTRAINDDGRDWVTTAVA